MKEEFLHFLWEQGLFEKQHLQTTDGQPLEIISAGLHNTDSGPDFFNAKIKIGETIWAGNVEIHRRASDWNRHIHSTDKAYDNVILHVVKDSDQAITRYNGEPIPVLQLNYSPALEARYHELQQSAEWIACGKAAKKVEPFRFRHFLSRLLVERLEQKSEYIYSVLALSQNDWRKAFYQLLFRAFGFGTNALPFELLAKAIPLAAIDKHRASLLQIEALLFGQAGLLNEVSQDEYLQLLQREYTFLQGKFSLTPIESHLWKFLRLRPSNFPTIRIAQLAKLLHQSEHLIDTIVTFRNVEEIYKLFDLQASAYWDTHFTFGNTSRSSVKTLGKQSQQRIITNFVVPYIFTYARHKADERMAEQAIELLETLPPEKNSIITGWESMGVMPTNTFDTQALIYLKQEYCNKKKCLHCSIGGDLLKATAR